MAVVWFARGHSQGSPTRWLARARCGEPPHELRSATPSRLRAPAVASRLTSSGAQPSVAPCWRAHARWGEPPHQVLAPRADLAGFARVPWVEVLCTCALRICALGRSAGEAARHRLRGGGQAAVADLLLPRPLACRCSAPAGPRSQEPDWSACTGCLAGAQSAR